MDARGAQVTDNAAIGATRVASRGWFKGKPERSVAYQMAFIPGLPGGEKTFAAFERNVKRVAERLAARFCQDSVLVLVDNGRRRTAWGATWTPPKRKRSKK